MHATQRHVFNFEVFFSWLYDLYTMSYLKLLSLTIQVYHHLYYFNVCLQLAQGQQHREYIDKNNIQSISIKIVYVCEWYILQYILYTSPHLYDFNVCLQYAQGAVSNKLIAVGSCVYI